MKTNETDDLDLNLQKERKKGGKKKQISHLNLEQSGSWHFCAYIPFAKLATK